MRTALLLHRQSSRVLTSRNRLYKLSIPAASTSGGSFQFQQIGNTVFKTTSSTKKEEKEKDDSKAAVSKSESDSKKKKAWILDFGVKSLAPDWKRMFKTDTMLTDISAGLTVGCVAVPLSLAIAVASGVPAEVGLVTAAVSGVAGGLLGGTTLAITGPAAAISLLVVGAVTEHGLEALPFITLACGGLQLASGVTRLGVMAKLVPVSVIAGFTTGVGTMILTGQVPKALGMTAPAGLNPIETISFIGENIGSMNPSAAALAVGTAGAMFLLPKIHPKMPSALLAVGGATIATHTLGLDVTAIGAIPSGLGAFQFGIPVVPSLDSLPSLSMTVFLIYAMTSAESLLSCAALEKMKKTPYKHNPDQELIGQGLANMGAAVFMGMPVTSVIARSGLNVRLNAESRLPALVQSGFVFSSVVFMSDSIAMIPMPALSGMLITTGVGMLNPQEFKHCHAVDEMDTLPFLATFAGMISFGLAEGIGIGCLSALAINIDYGSLQHEEIQVPLKRSMDEQVGYFQPEEEAHLSFHKEKVGDQMATAWQLEGPINFKSMFVIDDLMHRIQERKESVKNESIVLDMQHVTTVEFTGVEELVNRLIEMTDQDGTTIQMWNCNDDLKNAMDQCDPKNKIEAFCKAESKTTPYEFPEKEEAPPVKPVPYWYDSPNFRP